MSVVRIHPVIKRKHTKFFENLVAFIDHKKAKLVDLDFFPLDKVKCTAWSADDNVRRVVLEV